MWLLLFALMASAPLKAPGLHSPMPGGTLAGYPGDTGLDIGGHFLSVHAIASGTLEYSERGHTLWTRAPDTPHSVRLRLDEPIPWTDRRDPKRPRQRAVTHVYYTHMSTLRFAVTEGSAASVHVSAGELLGRSGIGNGVPHLHIGLLLDGDVSQSSWEFILREGEVRAVLGSYRNGARL